MTGQRNILVMDNVIVDELFYDDGEKKASLVSLLAIHQSVMDENRELSK